jgi:polyisoprenyl-phosphate glycosyltransferase
MTKTKVAAIVPAYNEVERISAVLDAIKSAKLVDEIVVVSDGSTDGTCELVSTDSAVRLIRLETNRGKGGAMRAGAENTDADVILFLDADLTGMDGEKVDMIIEPVVEGSADMAIGIFKSGRRSTDLAQVISPYISGQRAMRREVFIGIPKLETARSGVETAITKYFRRRGMRVRRVTLLGCTHFMKEEKLGFARGFAGRMKMYYDIGRIMLDGREFK